MVSTCRHFLLMLPQVKVRNGLILRDNFGYVRVPTTQSLSPKKKHRLSDEHQQVLEDFKGICHDIIWDFSHGNFLPVGETSCHVTTESGISRKTLLTFHQNLLG